jgi:hypothetical protein
MTLKDFYNWMRMNNFENFNILIKDNNDNVRDIDKCMVDINLNNKEIIIY